MAKETKKDYGNCPFLGRPCDEGKCALWGSVPIVRPGGMVGIVAQAEAVGCTFNLATQLISQPNVIPMAIGRRPGPAS